MPLVRQFLTGLLVFLLSLSAFAETGNCGHPLSANEQSTAIINTNLTGIGIVTAWGLAKWDYFSNSPRSTAEDWFQDDTKSGGADKLGHLYTSYVTSHGLSHLYESWCFNKEDAAFYGALSSFAIMGYMELGDSFSEFGFSREDLLANSVGTLFGYYLYREPRLANILDLRWEYGFHPDSSDFTTDYENSKYLFALKLNGFEPLQSSFLRHVELHLGYYTRGFSEPGDTKERNVFVGIGLNLTDLFRRQGHRKTATLLKYIQVPGTNIEFERDLNQ